MPNLICTHCHAALTKPYDIGQTWMIACKNCQTPHFLWEDHVRYADIPKPTFNPIRRFNIDQYRDGVAIRYFNRTIDATLLIGFLWFICFIFASIFPAPWTLVGAQIGSNPILLLIWLIYLVFITVSVMLAYSLLRLIVNRTTILLMSKVIQITEGPLPPVWKFILKNPVAFKIAPKLADRDFSHKQMMDISAIEQVNSIAYMVTDGEGDSHEEFRVRIENHEGTVIVLIDELSTHEQALFIELGIKQVYDIETQPHPALGIFKFSD